MCWRPVEEIVPDGTAVFESIIDPTLGLAADSQRCPAGLADRPERLSGLRLGLLANTKRNAEQFLDEVGRLLAEQHAVTTVVARKKPDITSTAPEPILDDLRLGCEIAVVGVGDCGSCSASAVADGIILEQSGIPAGVLCTEAFTARPHPKARPRGAPGVRDPTDPPPVAHPTPGGGRDPGRAAHSGD